MVLKIAVYFIGKLFLQKYYEICPQEIDYLYILI
jgi:hypothetical protein